MALYLATSDGLVTTEVVEARLRLSPRLQLKVPVNRMSAPVLILPVIRLKMMPEDMVKVRRRSTALQSLPVQPAIGVPLTLTELGVRQASARSVALALSVVESAMIPNAEFGAHSVLTV